MRRSFEDLQQRFTKREVRGISDADADGYLYAYVHSDEWKIGMTNDFSRRRDEWDRDCPDEWRIWLPPIRVANRRRSDWLPKTHATQLILVSFSFVKFTPAYWHPGYPNFYPPRPGQEEDILSESQRMALFYPRLFWYEAETFCFQSSISENLHSINTINKLGDWLNEVFARRANQILSVPPSTFRMPSRVTLNDTKTTSLKHLFAALTSDSRNSKTGRDNCRALGWACDSEGAWLKSGEFVALGFEDWLTFAMVTIDKKKMNVRKIITLDPPKGKNDIQYLRGKVDFGVDGEKYVKTYRSALQAGLDESSEEKLFRRVAIRRIV
ncbi:hypothetical protein F5051DRAFT_442020 [Lentinula edodes]|nr:hypothetical protein F5051DRAFT_442020 [Lentinula edodes]